MNSTYGQCKRKGGKGERGRRERAKRTIRLMRTKAQTQNIFINKLHLLFETLSSSRTNIYIRTLFSTSNIRPS